MRYRESYFALGELHPLRFIESLFNPYRQLAEAALTGRRLQILATRRAIREQERRRQPLGVEMQLYFSCVVKKRVLFHEGEMPDGERVGDNLILVFRPVEALACDPVEFAAGYPERRQFTSSAAGKMHPSHLRLDFRKGDWHGDFAI